MALPTNRIKNVKLQNNTVYEIIPEKVSDGVGNYAILPTLGNYSGYIALSNYSNTFTEHQFFDDSYIIFETSQYGEIQVKDNIDSGLNKSVAEFTLSYDDDDNFIGSSVKLPGHLQVRGDDDRSTPFKPSQIALPTHDLDTYYFNTGICLYDAGTDDYLTLSFPNASGTIGLEIEIVDLTSLA